MISPTAFNQTFLGGVRVAGCDLNQDGKTDIVAARGPLAQPEIRAFNGVTGNVFPPPLGSFLAFSSSDRGGVYVACGDLTGDTIPDIIAGKGAGQPPAVRVFNGVTAAPLPPPFGSFLAFNSTFPGGVRVASCDLNQDGRTDIIAGRGPGAQPEVRAFDGVSGAPFPPPMGSFLAFGASFRGGVYPACSPNDSGGGPPPADTAPEVTSTIPTNGATGVRTNSDLTITFNEPVAVAGDWFRVSCPTSGVRDVTSANTVVTGGPTVWTINPNTDFAPGEACTTTVFAAQITDVDSNDPPDNMAADFTFGFTIDAAPSVASTVPSNGATGVAVDSNITVNFSESVATTASTFGLECPAGTPIPFVVSPAPPGNTTSYTLNPNADLPAGTCTIKVTATQVTDVDTNDPPDTMVTDFTSTFTSGANNPPSFVVGPNQTVGENAGPQTVTPWATGIDDGDPESTQAVTFIITGNTDSSLFSAGPSVSPTGTLTYTPNSNAFGSATITLVLQDNGGTANPGDDDTSDAQSFMITVNPVNDPPSFTAGMSQTVFEDAGPQTVSPWATAISPGPANESGQTVSFNITSNSLPGLFTTGPNVSPAGVLTYTPAPNAFGTATIMLVAQDSDGGNDTSAAQGFSITVIAVNDPPVATPKTHQTHSGIRVTIGAGDTGKLKDGATDPDPEDAFANLIVGNIANVTPAGATVLLTNPATGTFTFNPPAGLSGTASASFTFDVCDDGPPPSGPALCDTETVTFNITGPDLWFVDDSAAAGGTGRLTDPFDSLADLPAGRGNGDRIFVFTGTYGTGHNVFTNEHLIGHGASGAFDTVLGVTVPGNGTLDTRPALGGARPLLSFTVGTVQLGGGSTVRGLNINSNGATGLSGGAVSGVTVNEASVSAANATAVNLGASGTFTLTRVDSSNATNGIVLNNNPTGSFTVTGTGAAGTGGTIQNITTRGASFINASNISLTNMNFTNASQNDGPTAPDGVVGGNSDENGAIHLQAAANVALTGVTITTTAQHGINGNAVRNLDLTTVTISGTGNEVWESGMFISNLVGRVSASQDSVFQNVNVSNTGQFNIYITNGTPTAAAPAEKDRLSITNGQFSNSGVNVIGDHITVQNVGTANFQTIVSGSTFTATPGQTTDNIQIDASGSSNSDGSISTSTFSNASLSGAAINLSASGDGVGTFSVMNNSNITVRAATGINLSATGPSSLRGTISGNTISTDVTNNPAFGIQAIVNDVGSIIANINNNTINGNGSTDFEYGIRGGARIANGTADITLQDNTVQSAKTAGVWLFSGNATAGETSRTCVNFVSNLIDGGSLAFTDYFVEQYTNTTFQIQGLVGLGTSATNVQNFIAATDDDPAAADPTVDAGSGTTVNYTNATCATP